MTPVKIPDDVLERCAQKAWPFHEEISKEDAAKAFERTRAVIQEYEAWRNEQKIETPSALKLVMDKSLAINMANMFLDLISVIQDQETSLSQKEAQVQLLGAQMERLLSTVEEQPND
jgi:hypothetical protein